MYEIGQVVYIRDHNWEVIDDRGTGGGDRLLTVKGIDEEILGLASTLIYRPGTEKTDTPEKGIDHVERRPSPELTWRPGTLPSAWERLHAAYQLSIAHTNSSLLSLSRARLVIEPYQLEPILRVLQAPRQRFLLAEDVGMGKTIEAGLIMTELIARGRANRILIVVPAALQDQWADEMLDKFHLEFKIIDHETLIHDILPTLPVGANPWNYQHRVITSIDFAKKERHLATLKKSHWDLIIVDEAHYLSESGNEEKRIQTERSKFGRQLATLSESLLLLTATPHNGYAQGFYSLLRLLDEARFSHAADLHRRSIEDVMIRRSKKHILNPDGKSKFQTRSVNHLTLDISDSLLKETKQLYEGLRQYTNQQWKYARQQKNQRTIIGFAMTLLKKRFISSPEAIRISLNTRIAKLGDELERFDQNKQQTAFESERKGLFRTEAEQKRQHNQAMGQTAITEKKALEADIQALHRLLRLAEAITPEKDAKTALLKKQLDTFSAQGRKVIVFTEYKDTLDYLQRYLEDRGYQGHLVTLHGEMNRAQRLSTERRFQEDETSVMLATDAASEGLNFQHNCYTIIHNELPWNPNRLEQRNGRVDRWGQTHPVEIYNLVLEGTLESHILLRLTEKLERIRKELGEISDVLSIAEELHLEDLDQRFMEEAFTLGDHPTETEELKITTKIDQELDQQLQQAKQRHQEWLASMHIAQPIFNLDRYKEIAAIQQQTSARIPHGKTLEDFAIHTLLECAGQAISLEEPHIWQLDIPQSLRGTSVKPRYARVTFLQEVAQRYLERRSSPNYLEYIAPGHPLLSSLIAAVKKDARDGGTLAGRMALRVLADEASGFLFTFLARWQDQRGITISEEIIPFFLPIATLTSTPEQAYQEAQRLLEITPRRRNVPPSLLEDTYRPLWDTYKKHAQQIAHEWCQMHQEVIRAERLPRLHILEEDLYHWAESRFTWVKSQLEQRRQEEEALIQPTLLGYRKEERERAAIAKRFHDSLLRTRKNIEFRLQERSKELAQMKEIQASAPEMLGGLVIISEEECSRADRI